MIARGEPLTPLQDGEKIILHLAALMAPYGMDLPPEVLDDLAMKVRPFDSAGTQYFNAEGALFRENGHDISRSYVQVFRNGIAEVVTTNLVAEITVGGPRYVASTRLEGDVIRAAHAYVSALAGHSLPSATTVMLSLTGVKNTYMPAGFLSESRPFGQDRIVVPEVVIEVSPAPSETARRLRGMFDFLWRASSFDRSPNFTDAGDWQPRR